MESRTNLSAICSVEGPLTLPCLSRESKVFFQGKNNVYMPLPSPDPVPHVALDNIVCFRVITRCDIVDGVEVIGRVQVTVRGAVMVTGSGVTNGH